MVFFDVLRVKIRGGATVRTKVVYGRWRCGGTMAAALRAVYTAPTVEAGESALDAFARGPWGRTFPDGGGVVAPRR